MLVAVVQPMDWADATPEFGAEIQAWTLEKLNRQKTPRSVDFMAELPRHPTGKLYKRLLRDKYWADAGVMQPGQAAKART